MVITPERSYARRALLASAVGALALLAYGNSLQGDFVWDDRPLILDSRMVRSFTNIGALFAGDFFSHSENPVPYGYYRPVTTLSYVVDWAVSPEHPFGFHVTNVGLHAAASVLVLLILFRLGIGERPSLVASALFAVHPVHSESVAWISGRTDVLAFVLTAAALLLHLGMRTRPADAAPRNGGRTQRTSKPRHQESTGGARSTIVAVVALVLFASAMLTKEMAAVLPLWVVLIALLYDRTGWRRALSRGLPYATVVAVYAVLRFAIIVVPAPGQPPTVTFGATLLSAPVTIVRYLGWMLLPLDLNAYVQNPYVESIADPRFWVSIAVLAAVCLGVARLARACPGLPLFASMLAVSFLPVLNLVRVASPVDMGNTMAERFCYFPSFPFVAALVVAAPVLLPPVFGRRHVAWATVSLLLVLSIGKIWTRSRDWRDDVSLFSSIVRRTPDAVLPWSQLALAHLRNRHSVDARVALEKAMRIDPQDYHLISLRTTLLVMEGRLEDAIPLQERLVRSAGPAKPVAVNNLAYLLRATGRTGEARRLLEVLVADEKAYADVWYNLGEVARQERRFDEALSAFERAAHLDPRDSGISQRADKTRVDLAHELVRAGRLAQARIYLEDVLARTADPELRRAAAAELKLLEQRHRPTNEGGS